jgi:FkbM family methyltransferase
MAWNAHSALAKAIWDEWAARGFPHLPGGDQEMLEEFFKPRVGWRDTAIGGKGWAPERLQDLFPGRFKSYKQECVWNVPKGTSVVFFHGKPRPHEVTAGWVPNLWKVGASSAREFVQVGTVDQAQVLNHIKIALAREYPEVERGEPHGGTAIIVGGGPSIADQFHYIAAIQQGGGEIFALNNADLWLRRRKITPDFHVMLDARPDLHDWINTGGAKLYASMCHPSVLHAGHCRGNLKVWHAQTDGAESLYEGKHSIGGGTTVGTRALVLAWFMGYRNFCVFGLDSSLKQDQHHAYPQPLNDTDPVYDAIVGGQSFKATGWMIQQVEDFKEIAGKLAAQGCKINVYGDGLLSAAISSMHGDHDIENAIEWPEGDIEAKPAIFATLKDLDYYVGMCDQRRVAVQAGGNVGVWPLHLAKYFNMVHTFEPDSVNYACLMRNVAAKTNISAMRAALGARESEATVLRQAGNSGATRIIEGSGVHVITLDSLGLSDVDLLQLDIEGYELFALKGAEQTILKYSPLIVLELKGHGEKYGYDDDQVIDWLRVRGYQQVGIAHRDIIFKRQFS